MSEISKNSSDDMRRLAVATIIAQSRLSLGYSSNLEPDEGDAMVAMWMPILAHIPTEFLQPSYVLAMRKHKSGSTFGVNEICEGWELFQEEQMRIIRNDPEMQYMLDRSALAKGEQSRQVVKKKEEDVPCPPEILKAMKETLKKFPSARKAMLDMSKDWAQYTFDEEEGGDNAE